MSLDLDERQRAMLREMNVPVWWPKPLVQIVKPPQVVAPPVRAALPAALKPVRQTPTNAPFAAASTDEHSSPATSLPTSVSTLSWPALQQAVSACQACALYEGRRQTVFGVGQPAPDLQNAPQVDWLIVGEAPGENEDRTGEPFVGQAGQLLDNMLKAMGLSRRDKVYIVNVIKCRPPGNRNPEATEIAQCEPYLCRQIELLQPKVILAMGRYAANSLLQLSVPDVHETPLGKLRGKVYGYASSATDRSVTIPVVVTYHPAYLLRNLPEKAKAWADLCLAMQVMKQQG